DLRRGDVEVLDDDQVDQRQDRGLRVVEGVRDGEQPERSIGADPDGLGGAGVLKDSHAREPSGSRVGTLGRSPALRPNPEQEVGHPTAGSQLGRGRGARQPKAIPSMSAAGFTSGRRTIANEDSKPSRPAISGTNSATWSANGRASVLMRMISAC